MFLERKEIDMPIYKQIIMLGSVLYIYLLFGVVIFSQLNPEDTRLIIVGVAVALFIMLFTATSEV
jgi:hypothetical protein